jgi:hypothetical protein
MTKLTHTKKQEVVPLSIIETGKTPPEEQKQLTKIFTLIGVPAIIGSTFTAATYLTGMAYHQKYLTYFHVNHGLFQKSSSEYFLFAWRSVVEILPGWLILAGADFRVPVVVFAMCLFGILIKMFSQALDRTERMERIRAKTRNSKAFATFGELIFVPTIGLAAIYYVPILLTLVLILPVEIGGIGAKQAAKADMARFEKGCKPVKGNDDFCIQIRETGKMIAHGFVIETSDKFIAIFEDGKARVLPIKEQEFLPFQN